MFLSLGRNYGEIFVLFSFSKIGGHVDFLCSRTRTRGLETRRTTSHRPLRAEIVFVPSTFERPDEEWTLELYLQRLIISTHAETRRTTSHRPLRAEVVFVPSTFERPDEEWTLELYLQRLIISTHAELLFLK